MQIQITKAEKSKIDSLPADGLQLGFGRYFTDHMFLLNYNPQQKWHNPRIEPYHDLKLDPAAMVFHYGQEVFEGLKAYRGAEDGIYLFRYRDNLIRCNRSCERMAIPTLDIDLVSEGLKQLILLDQDWIPTDEGCALYIRPSVIATDPFLGVRASETYLYYIIIGPVGAYYPEGFNPVSIYVSDHYVRAVPGGTGEAKTGGNYAGSLLAQREARQAGYSQVLWLDALEHRYIEEVGTMNIFFRIENTLYTSPLTGSILPGVTRDSVIQIAKSWDLDIQEQKLSIDEVIKAAEQGTLQEVFGSGTAAIISPVKSIYYKGKDYTIGDGQSGEISTKLYHHILDLQYGRIEDPFGWRERIN